MFTNKPLITGLLFGRRMPCDEPEHDEPCHGAVGWLTMLSDGDPDCCSKKKFGNGPELCDLFHIFRKMVDHSSEDYGERFYQYMGTIKDGTPFAIPFQIRQAKAGLFVIEGARDPVTLNRVPQICASCRRVNDANERGEFLALAQVSQHPAGAKA